MRQAVKKIQFAVAGVLAVLACRADAALPIELEVAVEGNAPLGTMQEWGKLLGGMDLGRLRLRGARRGESPSMTIKTAGKLKTFEILALVTYRNELIMPGGSFKLSDGAKLREFFQTLPERTRPAPLPRPFGLSMAEFERLRQDLGTPIGLSTAGKSPATIIASIAEPLDTQLVTDAGHGAISRGGPIEAELKGIAAGTGLAAVLRTVDLALIVKVSTDGRAALAVEPLSLAEEPWPVGWQPASSPRAIAPAMYKSTEIEIGGYTLAQAIDALTPHMAVPMLMDDRTLRARGVDPATIAVKLPASKTYIRKAVDRILGQARLAGELRVDDGLRPFYWMTQYAPESGRAPVLPVAAAEATQP